MSLAWTCMFKLVETGLKMCQRLYISIKSDSPIYVSDSPKLIVRVSWTQVRASNFIHKVDEKSFPHALL